MMTPKNKGLLEEEKAKGKQKDNNKNNRCTR